MPEREWMTIESAPMDGTEILAYGPEQGVVTVSYREGKGWFATWDGAAFLDYHDDWAEWNHDEMRPDVLTHWMHKPEPPATPSEEDR